MRTIAHHGYDESGHAHRIAALTIVADAAHWARWHDREDEPPPPPDEVARVKHLLAYARECVPDDAEWDDVAEATLANVERHAQASARAAAAGDGRCA